jgi:uncharacterized protein (TIGR02246 family)
MGSTYDEVAAFYGKVAQTWGANDGDAFAVHFTEDGSLINPFGERADGVAAVRAMYRQYFEGMLKGTTTTISLASVREVESSHALADADQTIVGPDGAVLLEAHVTNLLRKGTDGWSIVDSRPYSFATPPA